MSEDDTTANGPDLPDPLSALFESDFFQSYNLNHEPIGFFEGAMLLGTPETQLALDTINGHIISTVFLVHDHNHGHGPVPILYETMMTSPGGTEWFDRYPTREAALAGHDQACAYARSAHPTNQRRDLNL